MYLAGRGNDWALRSGPAAEGFRVPTTLEAPRRSHIKVEAGGVECVPGCLAPARSSPAAPFNPYCICSLRLLRARARPSRPGWTCPRLPAALACARRDAAALGPTVLGAGRRTPGALTGCREVPAASPGPPQPCAVPRDPCSPKAGPGTLLSTCGLQTGRRHGLHNRHLPVPQCCRPVTLHLLLGSLWSRLTMQLKISRETSH